MVKELNAGLFNTIEENLNRKYSKINIVIREFLKLSFSETNLVEGERCSVLVKEYKRKKSHSYNKIFKVITDDFVKETRNYYIFKHCKVLKRNLLVVKLK